MTPQSSLSIMADIGGTNTRVALASGLEVHTDTIRRFRNADFSGLAEVLQSYLVEYSDAKPHAACAAIAGPVRDGKGTLTNLDWTIDRSLLQDATGAGVTSVINDLQAQGHALEHLAPSSLRSVVSGQPAAPAAARLVVGVGTGFNAAPVYRTEAMTVIPPAEFGHADIPSSTEASQDFASHFAATNGFCSIEDALSGRGLGNIYRWLAERSGADDRKQAPEIMAACRDKSDPLAQQTVRFFAEVLGTVCGNLALSTLPFGGIYLVGGVSRAVYPYLADFGFAESLRAKGRFSEFMEQFPVHLVDDDYAALTGMAALLNELEFGPPDRGAE